MINLKHTKKAKDTSKNRKKVEGYALGVDLGGTNIKLGLVSMEGKIIKKTSIPSQADLGPDKVIEQIKKGIKKVFSEADVNIRGIGIGAPGIVSTERGTVENPPNFPGWKKINLGELIKKEFRTKVLIENDANAAAIGELIFGVGRKYDSFIMVTLGTGVGGGIIINRKIYRGEFGAAGEIGHITIDFNGPQCNCGSIGCIEAYIGNNYLIKRVREDLVKHPQSIIWQLVNDDMEKLTPLVIQSAMNEGDEYAKSIVRNMGIQLGAALASVSNLLDVSTFIIGGGVAGFGKPLFEEMDRAITARVLTPLRERVKVLAAELKNDAGIKGASALVFYKPAQ
jgi:glucokinase